MVGYPSPRREWSLSRKLDAIREAGFDGVAAYITPELKSGADTRGLKLMSGFDCGDLKVAEQRLKEQRDLGVHFINIQLLDHDTPPAPAAAMAVRLIKLSRRLGLGVHVEVHRDTCTETPEKYTEIARLYRRATGEIMPVTWDHSHFAVSKHVMPKDYSARLLVWPKEIQHPRCFTCGLSTASTVRCPSRTAAAGSPPSSPTIWPSSRISSPCGCAAPAPAGSSGCALRWA
jgi:hypothetical protein